LFTTWIGLLWGLVQGLRHALEPDHIAAVSTLVAERRSARSATSYAVVWGLGHAFVLLIVGGLLVLLRSEVPARVGAWFELVVAAMLLVLGARALSRALATARTGPAAPQGLDSASPVSGRGAVETGGGLVHAHAGGFAFARRPLVVGCIHGLAGSGAIAALVVAQMPSIVAGLAYIAVYGGGAALGMATLAGLARVPLAWLVRTKRGVPVLLATTGALSVVLGVAWGWSAAGPALR
jgi:hypothetical protein